LHEEDRDAREKEELSGSKNVPLRDSKGSVIELRDRRPGNDLVCKRIGEFESR
jgi:hypothetical protein